MIEGSFVRIREGPDLPLPNLFIGRIEKQFREFTTFFYQEVYDKENQEYDHRLI